MKIKGTNLEAVVNTVTPQVAKEMLATSRRNRRVQRSRVLRLSQAMKLGEWILGQPLMFNCDGTLIDGQHRLNAVIHSGKAIEFLVVRGYDREKTFGRIDDVSSRRLSHWLEIQGEAHPETLAAVITMAARHQAGLIPTTAAGSGGPGVGWRLTPIEGLDYLEKHPEIRKAVEEAPGQVSTLAPRSLLCFAYLLFCEKDRTLAGSFLIELSMGDSEGETDPIFLLRQRLKNNRYSKTKLSRTELFALIVKTWNAVRAGQKVRQLKWTSTGPGAEPFPEVQ